jgi:hypothetical protein
VFVCGGGSYYEYETMHRLEEEMKIQVIYGTDHLFNAEEFLQELQKSNRWLIIPLNDDYSLNFNEMHKSYK